MTAATEPGPHGFGHGPADDAGLAHLYRRIGVVEARVRALVDLRRADDPDPDDRFRGLYVADAHVDRILATPPGALVAPEDDALVRALTAIESHADGDEAAGADLRLRRLARAFGLDALDVELLLVALAPDLDPRFERLYGYLNDDVSRRRASTGLALELCRPGSRDSAARRRLADGAALVAGGLLLVEEPERPFLTRSLRVPDRVTAHLLGDDAPIAEVEQLLAPVVAAEAFPPGPVERGLVAGARLFYLREAVGAAGSAAAATGYARAGLPCLRLDLERLPAGAEVDGLAAAAVREARLLSAGLVVGPVEVLAERGPAAVRAFTEVACPVALVGARTWDPAWARSVALVVDAPVPTVEMRRSLWLDALDRPPGGDDDELDAGAVIAPFRLTPEQIARAAAAARLSAEVAGADGDGGLSPADLQAGARAQNAAGLERLARRLSPRVSWHDLVLPAEVRGQLLEIAARARHRDLVLDSWRMGRTSAKGRGVSALFAGDSGTGKTMSAEVLAGDLGLDLYVIDLSSVVDKYIGETEKNLDRIFGEADRVNGVLLFDEADALFGKRSEVSDAKDRYANVEVAYLLQRMELFDGVAILTTNLRANLDEAFTRRLDAIVDFPLPEVDDRRRLWAGNLRPELPRTDDVDLDFLSRSFKLAGGEIRNVAVTAAYLAAAEGRPVGMADLVRAVDREYRKLGRLTTPSEFGVWFDHVRS